MTSSNCSCSVGHLFQFGYIAGIGLGQWLSRELSICGAALYRSSDWMQKRGATTGHIVLNVM
jgi:hypothetical protein